MIIIIYLTQVYRVTHMYDSTVITLDCVPSTITYTNGLLIVGEDSGGVKVIDPSNGKCLQQFSDHKARVTDIYAVSVYIIIIIIIYYNILHLG